MPRTVLHAHRGGWESALDHPSAVVIDYPAQTIRQGTARFEVKGRKTFAFLAFMLRGADLVHARAAVAQAVFADHSKTGQAISDLIKLSGPALAWLQMTITTHNAAGLVLHTVPRETLPCRDQLAPSQKLPTHVRSRGTGANTPPATPARLLPASHQTTERSTPRPLS